MNNFITFIAGGVAGFFLEKILDFLVIKIRGLGHVINGRKQKKFQQTIESKEYITFQNNVLRDYYGEAYFTNVFDLEYPAFCIPGKCDYPFENLCNKDKLTNDKKIDFKKLKYYKQYRNIVSKNIKRPKMQGFMLDSFILDENKTITGIQSWVGTFDENVYTSHILEYELYKAYNRYGRKDYKYNFLKISKYLKLRNDISANESINSVLTTGCNRASLLGVQMLIVFINSADKKYNVLTIKRSEDVAARPGYYQFAPAGGFEVYENSDEHNLYELQENYSVLKALYREYVEELHGVEDFEYGHGGETISKILKNEQVKLLEKFIEEKSARFEFLGSVVDLTGLRHELSFVLVIDDEEFSKQTFKSNSESKKISITPIDSITKAIDPFKLNPSSAALWSLFINSNLYKDIVQSNHN